MPYPEEWVRPAREELSKIGVQELRNAKDVDRVLANQKGTALVVVNSICGCAAGSARPAVAKALAEGPRPDTLASVFAGQDLDATERAREYFKPQPPSSPSVALMKDGQLVYMMHRNLIEGRTPDAIAKDLSEALKMYCSAD